MLTRKTSKLRAEATSSPTRVRMPTIHEETTTDADEEELKNIVELSRLGGLLNNYWSKA